MTTVYIKSKHSHMLFATFEDYIEEHSEDFDLNFDGLHTVVAYYHELHKAGDNVRKHLRHKKVHLLDHDLDCHQRMFLCKLERKLDTDFIYDKPSRWDLLWWIWTFWQLGFWLTLAIIKRGRITFKNLL